MRKISNKNLEKQLEENIRRKILTNVEYGEITPKDFKNYEKLWPKIRKAIFGDDIVDYKTSVITQARKFSDAHLIDFSRVFYAIYFEHLINRIIYVVGRQKGLSDFSIKSALRFGNVEAKLTWLLELLGISKLNAEYLKVLKALFEKRNSFIHYKWNITQLENAKSTKAWLDEHKSIEKCAIYLKKFEAKAIYKNRKRRLKDEVSKIGLSVKVGKPIRL